MSLEEMSTAFRLRRFLRELFGSRHTKWLEDEMVRLRAERDGRERQLLAEKLELVKKIEKLELAIWPTTSRAGAIYAAHTTLGQERTPQAPPRIPEDPGFTSSWGEALRQHNVALGRASPAAGSAASAAGEAGDTGGGNASAD